MMITKLTLPALLAVALLLTGCATPPEPEPVAIPTLFEIMHGVAKDLNSSGGLAVVGIGESKSPYLALNYAKKNGRSELIRKVETKLADLQHAFTAETETAGDPTIIEWFSRTGTVISNDLKESIPIELQQEPAEENVRIYALFDLDPQQIADALALDDELYTRFRATRVFDALNKEIETHKSIRRL